MKEIRKIFAALLSAGMALGALAVPTVENEESEATWMVVDLTTGEIQYYNYTVEEALAEFNTGANASDYKTTKMVFRKVPAGTYYVQDSTSTTATLDKAYWIGMYEVTVGQYTLMKNSSASVTATAANMLPQASVSWQDIRGTSAVPTALGANLTSTSPIGVLNTTTGRIFDLPTEAMWEVAARAMDAGDSSHATWKWFFGLSDSSLGEYAWWWGNTSYKTHEVGTKKANGWGLFDVYGNVLEWCLDGTGTATWNETPNVANVASYDNRRHRGGGYNSSEKFCRSGSLSSDSCGFSSAALGFRLASLVTGEDGEGYLTRVVLDVDGNGEEDVTIAASRANGGLITPLKEESGETIAYNVTGVATIALAGAGEITLEEGELVTVGTNGVTSVARGTTVTLTKTGEEPVEVVGPAEIAQDGVVSEGLEESEVTWMVVDLTTGEIQYYDYTVEEALAEFNTGANASDYKTTKMVFRKVPAGTYYVQDSTSTTATLDKAYWIGMYEVTVGQYTLMTNSSASVTATEANMLPQASVGLDTIRGVSAVPTAMGANLTTTSPIGVLNTTTGRIFDLPTEAMWEVAARAMDAGDSSHATWQWFFGSSNSSLGDYAWYSGNSSYTTHEVGTKKANDWGLFDVYGNVREWCLDGTGTATWNETPNVESGPNRRCRGGSYDVGASSCCSGLRLYNLYYTSYANLGFRLASLVTGEDGERYLTRVVLDVDGNGEEDVTIAARRANGGQIALLKDEESGETIAYNVTGVATIALAGAGEITIEEGELVTVGTNGVTSVARGTAVTLTKTGEEPVEVVGPAEIAQDGVVTQLAPQPAITGTVDVIVWEKKGEGVWKMVFRVPAANVSCTAEELAAAELDMSFSVRSEASLAAMASEEDMHYATYTIKGASEAIVDEVEVMDVELEVTGIEGNARFLKIVEP